MIGRGGRPASGRELYEKWRRPLKLVERSFSILPAGLRRAALGCLAVLPGSVGMAFRVIALRDRGAGVGDAVYIARSAVFKNVRRLQIRQNDRIRPQRANRTTAREHDNIHPEPRKCAKGFRANPSTRRTDLTCLRALQKSVVMNKNEKLPHWTSALMRFAGTPP